MLIGMLRCGWKQSFGSLYNVSERPQSIPLESSKVTKLMRCLVMLLDNFNVCYIFIYRRGGKGKTSQIFAILKKKKSY